MTIKPLPLFIMILLLFTLSPLSACGKGSGAKTTAADTSLSQTDGTAAPNDGPGRTGTATDLSAPVFEYEYLAPSDGSFKICGTDLSDYVVRAYCPEGGEILERLKDSLGEDFQSATGMEIDFNIDGSTANIDETKGKREILFGTVYSRDGMPEISAGKSDYGVTADGIVYFRSPGIANYPYMWRLFLQEFFGYKRDSGEKSRGCSISTFHRVLPDIDQERLEAAGYRIAAEDEFYGEKLDTDLWEYRGHGVREGGFLVPGQVSVSNGNLYLKGSFIKDGEFGDGWYSSFIAMKKWFRRGYFEARIKVSKNTETPNDFWSAFWLQGPFPYEADKSQGGSGPGGAELDIMENWAPGKISSRIWVTGYEESSDLSSEGTILETAGMDYSRDFYTYSLLWDKDYYRFYVNGVLVMCSDFGYGTSPVKEQVILSLCVPEEIILPEDTVRTMTVDYVRVWQKPGSE